MVGRYNHSFNISGEYIFLYGGNDHNFIFSDFSIFSLKDLNWTYITQNDVNPGKRYGHSSVVYKGDLYIFGGRNDKTFFNDLWKYDVEKSSWNCIKINCYDECPKLFKTSSVLFNNYALIFHGSNSYVIFS